jgi:hypothetical protein
MHTFMVLSTSAQIEPLSIPMWEEDLEASWEIQTESFSFTQIAVYNHQE